MTAHPTVRRHSVQILAALGWLFGPPGLTLAGLAGPGRGYIWTGFLGGLISSTNVTWTFSRLSGRERHLAATGSAKAAAVLADWPSWKQRFKVLVTPS